MEISTLVDYVYKFVAIGTIGFVAYQSKNLSEQIKLAKKGYENLAEQIKLAKKDYNLKNDKAEREKAIELSKFYSDDILLSKITYIETIFESCGIEKLIENISYSRLFYRRWC